MHTSKLLVAIAALSTTGIASAKGTRRTKRLHTPKNKNGRGRIGKKDKDLLTDEDVVFWTRLLQVRGKETDIDGSLPFVPRPPAGGNNGGGASPNPPPRPQPRPMTKRPTPKPIPSPSPPTPVTPPSPSGPTFRCPSPSLVGCTATDPTNPINECDAVGELCAGSQFDHCCFDQCPRKYCTAKEAPP
mmetsp:Transcript_34168/g.82617  ORF Transcript_34168/g.82617 Transcript_34168/m.82617 type:complete len:187 (-) Transcript_34168:279-839(-)